MFPPTAFGRLFVLVRYCLVLLAIALVGVAPATADDQLDRLTIVVPAAPAGGWDQTAHVMARVLQSSGIVPHVEIVNSPGAGGAIALAEFVNGRRGDGSVLLVGGLVMISAIRASHATVSLLQTTPLARLIAESEVIVVPAGSQLKTMQDLVAVLKADPAEIAWAGGSYGGTDQVLLYQIAQAIGVDATAINYVPFAGGGEGLAALLANQSTAGVAGYAEFASGIQSGRLRALAVSSEARLHGVPIPTLKEQGINVAVMNWRGVFAPPDISVSDRDRLTAIVDRMVHHPLWRESIAQFAWTDLYLAGSGFATFVTAEQQRTDEYFARASAATHPPRVLSPLRGVTDSRWTMALVAVMLAFSIPLLWRWRAQTTASRSREHALNAQLEVARHDAERDREKARELLKGLGEEIDKQFDQWALTSAEREIALLMLKGLRHKDIAVARNTTERTVRQQALSVYKKAGLDGRTDLAAYFLEDLLPPRTAAEESPGKGAPTAQAGKTDPPVKVAS